MVAALHSYSPYLAQIVGFLVTCGVQMMSLRHGWGWQTPQTAGGGLGPILEPKPANLSSWSSCSCQLQFLPPTKNKLLSSSADPAQCWNDTINSFMVWTLLSYRFSKGCGQLMVLCPVNMAPCPKAILSMRRRLYWGVICTSSKNFFGPAAALEHHPDVMFWSGVGAGAAQVQYWSLHLRPQRIEQWYSAWCVDEASCTK